MSLPPAAALLAVAHAPRPVPPIGWVALALAAYVLVLVPAVLWGLRRMSRENLAWLVLPVVALAVAVGLWFVARHAPGPSADAGRAALRASAPRSGR